MEGNAEEVRSINSVVTDLLASDNPCLVIDYYKHQTISKADLTELIEQAPVDLLHRIIASEKLEPDPRNLTLLAFILNETAFNPFARNPYLPPYESPLEKALRLQLTPVVQLFVEQDLLIVESDPEKALKLPSKVILDNCLIIGNFSHPGQYGNIFYNWKTLRQNESPERREQFSRRFRQFLKIYPDSPTSQFISYLLQQLKQSPDRLAAPKDFISSKEVMSLLEKELTDIKEVLEELQAIAENIKGASYSFVPPIIAALCLSAPVAALSICYGCLRGGGGAGCNISGESLIAMLVIFSALMVIGPALYFFLLSFPFLVVAGYWPTVCDFLANFLEIVFSATMAASTTIPSMNTTLSALTGAGSTLCWLELITVPAINIIANSIQACRQKVMEKENQKRLEPFEKIALPQNETENLFSEEGPMIPKPNSKQILASGLSFYKEHYDRVKKSLKEKKEQLPQSKRLEFYSKSAMMKDLLFAQSHAQSGAYEIRLEDEKLDLQII